LGPPADRCSLLSLGAAVYRTPAVLHEHRWTRWAIGRAAARRGRMKETCTNAIADHQTPSRNTCSTPFSSHQTIIGFWKTRHSTSSGHGHQRWSYECRDLRPAGKNCGKHAEARTASTEISELVKTRRLAVNTLQIGTRLFGLDRAGACGLTLVRAGGFSPIPDNSSNWHDGTRGAEHSDSEEGRARAIFSSRRLDD
jgi:hypothetical protein